jgi:hypothetical protein
MGGRGGERGEELQDLEDGIPEMESLKTKQRGSKDPPGTYRGQSRDQRVVMSN